MRDLTKENLFAIAQQIAEIEKQHPTAQVVYNTDEARITIIYPLPKDFWTIKNISIEAKS